MSDALEAASLEQLRLDRKKQEWASWVNDEFQKCKNSRAQFERQWYLNMAFTAGRHYVSPINVNGQGFKLSAPQAPPWRVRLVINKIRKAVRSECSKLTSSRPVPTVMPATDEEEDFQAARVAEQLVRNAFSNADFERTYRSWIWWGVVCGNSFLKSYWAPNEPDPDLMMPAKPMLGAGGQPLTNPATGEPIMIQNEPVKGRIMMERVTPFHVYVPDLLTEDLNKQPYIIHATTRDPLWVKRNFGINATPDTKASSTIIEAAFLITKNSEDHMDSVLVKEVWLKPFAHKDFPKGGILTVINDKIVQWSDEWPWPFPEYPFYKYDGIPTGGFYSDSIVVDLIPLNKEYNKTRSQMVEIKNTMGKPKLLYPKGSVNPRQISSEPGQGIPYVPGFGDKPQVLPAAEVPSTMVQELDQLRADFDDLSGQHEISRGSNPTGVTSGTAISFLQEQDDLTLNYQISSIEYAMEMLGKHYLKYVSKYWKDDRLIRITGKDSAFEAKMWKGSSLRGNTDVRIQTGSALPVSKAARQAMLTEFMQYGWLDPTTGMELMDMGGFDKALDEMLIDKKQATRENLKMAELDPEEIRDMLKPPMLTDEITGEERPLLDQVTGQPIDEMGQPWMPKPPIPTNSWDNHEAHIQWHNNYRKTQEFELLADEVKEAFELHVQQHQMAISAPMTGMYGQDVTQHMDPEQAAMMEQQGMSADQQMFEQEQAASQQEFDQGQAMQQGALNTALTKSQIAMNEAQIAQMARQAQQGQ